MSGDKEEKRTMQPESQSYAGGTCDLSLDSELKSALRIQTSELINRLSLDDAKNLAYLMWSSENIDGREFDAIAACSKSATAVIMLLRLALTRGDTAIIAFAKALRDIDRHELAEKILPSAECSSPTRFDQSTDDELRSNFRRLLPQIHEALDVRHVHDVAHRMWSANTLNGMELQVITSCTEKFTAVHKLTDFAYARGGASIKGLAKTLNDIEMFDLAKKIFPAVLTTVTTVAQASDSCLDSHAETAAATRLSENLRHYSVYIAQRLTDGEIDGIIAVLRSTKDRYLSDLDYEELKVLKGATRKASSLIHTLVIKGDGAVQLFAKALKDFGRKELSSMILYGSTSGH